MRVSAKEDVACASIPVYEATGQIKFDCEKNSASRRIFAQVSARAAAHVHRQIHISRHAASASTWRDAKLADCGSRKVRSWRSFLQNLLRTTYIEISERIRACGRGGGRHDGGLRAGGSPSRFRSGMPSRFRAGCRVEACVRNSEARGV